MAKNETDALTIISLDQVGFWFEGSIANQRKVRSPSEGCFRKALRLVSFGSFENFCVIRVPDALANCQRLESAGHEP